MSIEVSICCITYNHEKYIRDGLEGFLMQKTDFPFEIIIHDDASTDSTADIIRSYEKKYPELFTCIYQKENQWSKGIRPSPSYVWPKARGKYIALCEGDDYWDDPEKLSFQYDFLESNPDYVLVGGYAKTIRESEGFKIIHDNPPKYDPNFDFDTRYLIRYNPLSTPTAFFRNGVIKEFPDIYFKGAGGDRRLYMLLSLHGKCKFFKKPWGVYRIHSGGVTQNQKGENEIAGIEARLEVIKRWDKYFNYKYSDESELALRAYLKKLLKLYIKEVKIIKSIICVLKLLRVVRY